MGRVENLLTEISYKDSTIEELKAELKAKDAIINKLVIKVARLTDELEERATLTHWL